MDTGHTRLESGISDTVTGSTLQPDEASTASLVSTLTAKITTTEYPATAARTSLAMISGKNKHIIQLIFFQAF